MNKTHFTLFAFVILFLAGCKYTQKIRDGRTAFDRKQFSVAIPMLEKEYKKTKSRVEKGKIAFMIGESYRKTNQSEKSINWYLSAYDYQAGVDALKEYAHALKRNEQYTEAKEAFKNLGIEIGSPYEYRREILACTQAEDWKKETPVFNVELTNFNTSNADYAPVHYQDNQLVFTSDRSTNQEAELYNWTGQHFSDLFLVNLQSSDVQPFDLNINSNHNDGALAFNADYTELYFTRCYSEDKYGDNYCKLMVSKKEGDQWSVPEVLNFIEEKVNYGHPTLSKDGNTLYFSSNHSDGWGGYDLYSTTRTPEGWNLPKVMGRSINTIGNEKFPYIHEDTLYFSSDYHGGMGGLDIFRTYKMGEDRWSPTHNLKAPVNSGADDFGFIVDRGQPQKEGVLQTGYFTSSRQTGLGNDDIYRYEKIVPPPPQPVDTFVELEPIVYKMLLNVYVLEKIYKIEGNPNSAVLGRKPLNNAVVKATFGQEEKTFTVGEDGLWTIELTEEESYSFFASSEGYLNNTGAFSSKGIGKDPNNPILIFEVEIVLDKIFKDKEITLDNIYYDYDQWDIRNDAQPTLNELAVTLQRNPNIKIQLSSHTDCRGRNNYNESLSQKRAQSAVDYLISQGIAPERLVAKGYGENALAIDCSCTRCTEDEHQANRRTTFKILDNS